MGRPNLLLFMPDQLRADAVGAFGNPVARTPHIDALAADGVEGEIAEDAAAATALIERCVALATERWGDQAIA